MEEIRAELASITGALNAMIQRNTENERTINRLNEQLNLQRNPGDLFRIPDPIKSIPSYDGNRNQLNAWLKTVQDTLDIFRPNVTEQHFKIYSKLS
jgi:hypothetical protein